MMRDNSSLSIEVPPRMREKLDDYRRRVWAVKVAEGLLAGVFGLFVSYLVVFAFDRFGETPATVRVALLLAGSLGLAVFFPLKCHKWVWRHRRLDQLARLLKHKFPRFGDHMLGIIELAQSDTEVDRSPELVRAAIHQVDEEISQRDFSDAVPHERHRRWAYLAAIPVALTLAALLFVPAAGSNAMARWLMPWRNIERYTFTQIDNLPETKVVPLAESFDISVNLTENTAWTPETGAAKLSQQPMLTADLKDHRYKFEVPPQREATNLKLSIGDARKQVKIQPKARPELKNLVAHIKLPDYLQRSEPVEQDVRGGLLSVIEGSQATFKATLTSPIASATIDGQPAQVAGATITSSPVEVTESVQSEMTWQDKDGLTARQPFVLKVNAQKDEAPTLLAENLKNGMIVMEEEVISFNVQANDDFGIKQIGLVWNGAEDPIHNPHPSKGEKKVAGGAPDQESLSTTTTFCPQRENVSPQLLRLRLYAEDYLPGRKRSYSPTYSIYVLSAEEHAIWLTAQFRKWFRQSQEVYDREQQLYDTNRQLRDLSQEELDTAAVRRQIQTQAAAEKANARRLGALTSVGQQLVKQATKNDQFNVQTLETWAEMLQRLEEINAKRMPSVANLLGKAANAQASGAGKSGKPGKPGPPSASSGNLPTVGNNRGNKSGKGAPSKPGAPNKAPGVSDVESDFNKAEEDQGKKKQPGKSSPGSLKLPVTSVQGGGKKKKPGADQPSPAKEQMQQAVEEQTDLLAEFAKVAEELQKILGNLEGSTFVKRLKAASRKQTDLAKDLNRTLRDTFGQSAEEVREASRKTNELIARRERDQSETLYTIQDDLEAYFNRMQEGKFGGVLEEMKESGAVTELASIATTMTDNHSGQSIADTELWADRLDRWAEQLVGPGCPNCKKCKGGKSNSLPPSVVLEVMKILEKEIALREETRSLQKAKPVMQQGKYGTDAKTLSTHQGELKQRTSDVIEAIVELPEGAQKFGKEIAMLTRVSQVMDETEGLLARPDTGPEAIAAETEAIELLLQTKRSNPKSSGGGGSSPGGGGSGTTQQSALALLGKGSDKKAKINNRAAGQSTGISGKQLPEEYREGLDTFLNSLDEIPGVSSSN